jgi:hypothetical protein
MAPVDVAEGPAPGEILRTPPERDWRCGPQRSMGIGAVFHRANRNAAVAHRANGALAQWATALTAVGREAADTLRRRPRPPPNVTLTLTLTVILILILTVILTLTLTLTLTLILTLILILTLTWVHPGGLGAGGAGEISRRPSEGVPAVICPTPPAPRSLLTLTWPLTWPLTLTWPLPLTWPLTWP